MRFADQFFRIADIDEAAGNDIRPGQGMARPFGQSHDDDDDPFHSQLLAVTDDDVADIADAEAVDEDAAGIDMARLMAGTVRELKDLAVVADEDVVLGDAIMTARSPWVLSMRYSPWTGMKYFGLISSSMSFNSSWLAMARYVDFLIPAGDDVGTEVHEVIDGAADAGFIARDRRCRNDDRIARHDAAHCGDLLEAMRDKPAIGSPWLPVVRMRI